MHSLFPIPNLPSVAFRSVRYEENAETDMTRNPQDLKSWPSVMQKET
jgi:hypothetical protein